ncbi:MAG TPA: FecR family protein [Polyangia bacterium]|nr:FecR family protein [Polyangia bacterium]
MNQLRYPLKDRLQDPVTERALQRVWRGIDEQSPRRHRRRRLHKAALAVLAIIASAGLGLAVHLRQIAPLRLSDGRPLRAVDASAEAVLALNDGSRIHLWPGTYFEPIESSSSTFTAVLHRGEARFDVRPGGPRRWLIECGLATVEVLGTEFHCRRTADRLRVSVERGTVLVRGQAVPDRVRLLTAGDSLEVVAPDHPR